MFVERSVGRIRLARGLFVLLGLGPCLALAAWAWHRGSASHREAVTRSWERAVGLPLEVGAVTHPRPGVVVATECVLRSAAGRTMVRLPQVEVESAGPENRIRIGSVQIDAAAVADLAALAGEWLRHATRHPRNCVVAVDEVICPEEASAGGDAAVAAGLRIECVVQDGARAVRIVRAGGDEIRIVRTLTAGGDEAGGERIDVDGLLAQPVPAALIAAAAGFREAGAPLRTAIGTALVTGTLHASSGGAPSSGSASGRIHGIDVADFCASIGGGGAGVAAVQVRRLVWREGRLADLAVDFGCGPGWVDNAVFDRLVVALGFRPGPAAAQMPADRRGFDTVACGIDLEGVAVRLRGSDSSPDGVALAAGGVVLRPPPDLIGFDRLAWMLSPPAATFVPAAGPGAWLMSIVPAAAAPASVGPNAMRPAPQGGRRGF